MRFKEIIAESPATGLANFGGQMVNKALDFKAAAELTNSLLGKWKEYLNNIKTLNNNKEKLDAKKAPANNSNPPPTPQPPANNSNPPPTPQPPIQTSSKVNNTRRPFLRENITFIPGTTTPVYPKTGEEYQALLVYWLERYTNKKIDQISGKDKPPTHPGALRWYFHTVAQHLLQQSRQEDTESGGSIRKFLQIIRADWKSALPPTLNMKRPNELIGAYSNTANKLFDQYVKEVNNGSPETAKQTKLKDEMNTAIKDGMSSWDYNAAEADKQKIQYGVVNMIFATLVAIKAYMSRVDKELLKSLNDETQNEVSQIDNSLVDNITRTHYTDPKNGWASVSNKSQEKTIVDSLNGELAQTPTDERYLAAIYSLEKKLSAIISAVENAFKTSIAAALAKANAAGPGAGPGAGPKPGGGPSKNQRRNKGRRKQKRPTT